MNGSKLPHRLRIIILLLRLELGTGFFYLGWSALFDPPLGRELGAQTLHDLYAWIGAAAASGPPAFHAASAWALIAIGIFLAAGLLTRAAAIAGIALTAASYAQAQNFGVFRPSGLANDGLLVMICLLIIVFSNAGEYIGLDKFIHVHLPRKRA